MSINGGQWPRAHVRCRLSAAPTNNYFGSLWVTKTVAGGRFCHPNRFRKLQAGPLRAAKTERCRILSRRRHAQRPTESQGTWRSRASFSRFASPVVFGLLTSSDARRDSADEGP